ncbi:hypothetical protein [Streptococcus cuniculi]|uniref:Uncharacterized protein n=1 Tax=Streptococcus cuniculi TaxID=1432788 RepID=A0A4Y9JCP2_9STRE|nr:hypothetical protein [Streptococcus cuniculi]MBF0778345.1 hypothetical protein [Streptococcus cuniculi]TFU97836.1 hypothetical protein E4T82_06335 [Streptococcus cuniculi]
MKKRCIKCHQEKELNETNFPKKKNSKTGFDSRCKDCRRQMDKQRYEAKRDKILEQKKRYYQRRKIRKKIELMN